MINGANRRYPGTRPFADSDLDRALFHGREELAATLLHIILADPLVVVYGRSGTGKTSLMNAGILQKLRAQEYFPVVVRCNDPVHGPFATVYDKIRETAALHGVEYVQGPTTTLWDHFAESQFWHNDVLLTPVIIFDQFEEIFTDQTAANRQRFIEQFAELIRGRAPVAKGPAALSVRNAQVKVVVQIREDFLGHLEELSPKIPHIMHNRCRVTAMERDDAKQAIVKPAGASADGLDTAPFGFTPGTVGKLLDFLTKQSTELGVRSGVEPFQLQLVCQYIEERAERRAEGMKERALPLVDYEEDLGGDSGIREMLDTYYEDQISAVAAGPRERRRVKRMCEDGLVSPQSRRRSVAEEELLAKYRVGKHHLNRLLERRLIRFEPRLGTRYYELSHDTLVEPVVRARQRAHDAMQQRVRRAAYTFAAVVAVFAIAYFQFTSWRAAIVRDAAAVESLVHSDAEAALMRAVATAGRDLVSRRDASASVARALATAVQNAKVMRASTDLGATPIAFAATPRGEAVAVATSDGRLRVLDDAGELLGGTSARVAQLAYSPAGDRIAAIENDGATISLRAWNVAGAVQKFAVPGADATAIAFAEGQRLAVGHRDGSLSILFLDDGQWSDRQGATDRQVSKIATNGSDVATIHSAGNSGEGDTIRLWGLESGQPLPRDSGLSMTESVSATASASNGWTAVAFSDTFVTLIDAQGRTMWSDYVDGPVVSLAFSPSGRQLAIGVDATSTSTSHVVVLSVGGGAPQRLEAAVPARGAAVFQPRLLAFDPAGRRLAAAGDRFVMVWPVDTASAREGVARDEPLSTSQHEGRKGFRYKELSSDAVPYGIAFRRDSGMADEWPLIWTQVVRGKARGQLKVVGTPTSMEDPDDELATVAVPADDHQSAPSLPTLQLVRVGDEFVTLDVEASDQRIFRRHDRDGLPKSEWTFPRPVSAIVDTPAGVAVAAGDGVWLAAPSSGLPAASQFREIMANVPMICAGGTRKSIYVIRYGRNAADPAVTTPTTSRGLRQRLQFGAIAFTSGGMLIVGGSDGRWRALSRAAVAFGLGAARVNVPFVLSSDACDFVSPAAQRHKSTITSIAVSADASRIVTAASDGSRLWSLNVARLPELSSEVLTTGSRYAALSADGASGMVVNADRRRVTLARFATDPFSAPATRGERDAQANIRTMSVSRNGRFIASLGSGRGGEERQVLSIIDAETHEQLIRVTRIQGCGEPSAFAISPDSQFITVGCTSGAIVRLDWHLFSLPGGPWRPPQSDAADRAVVALAYSEDGQLLAGADAKGLLKVWRAGGELIAVRLTRMQISALDVSTAADSIVVGGDDGSLKVFAATNRGVDQEPVIISAGKSGAADQPGHTERVSAVAFSPDGRTMASASADGTARFWDWRDRKALSRTLRYDVPVSSIAYSSDGQWVALCTGDGATQVIAGSGGEPPAARFARTMTDLDAGPLRAAFSRDGNYLYNSANVHRVSWRAGWRAWLHTACETLQRSRRYRLAADADTREARGVCRQYAWPDEPQTALASLLPARRDAVGPGIRETFAAITDGDLGVVQRWIGVHGGDAELDGVTALDHAVQHDSYAAAALLLQNGGGKRADVNRRSKYRVTPLYRAAMQGSEPLTRLLLAAGADVNAADASGVTPLMVAAQRGELSIVTLLVAKGAAVNAADVSGRTALMRAAKSGNDAVVDFLLQHHADLTHESTLYGRRSTAVSESEGQTRERLETALNALPPSQRGADLRDKPIEWTLRVDLGRYIPPRFAAARTEILYWQDQFARHAGTEATYRRFEAIAASGDPFAEFLVGNANRYGLGTRKDLVRAAEWYRRSAEHQEPLGKAFYALALQRADGVQQRSEDAIRLIRDAAASSDVGKIYLAMFAETDCKRVTAEECASLRDILTEAAKNGDGVAHNILAWRIDHESGSTPDRKVQLELLDHYRAAAAARDVPGSANYGLWLLQGWSGKRELAEASRYVEYAAGLGYGPAMRVVGTMYFTGVGREKSFPKAYDWYRRAAAALPSDTWADNAAASMLEQGLGVAANPDEAARLYRRASKASSFASQKLASMGLLP